jgi:chalcone synthase
LGYVDSFLSGDNSCIKKRHTFLTPELFKAHPELLTYWDNSLTTRNEIVNKVVPEIAYEAAVKAVKEWGHPLSDITHMVFATTTNTSMPGADLKIARMLGLHPTVQRVCLYQTGCWGGGAVLRIARNLAESAKGARVLVVVAEANTVMNFRAPNQDTLYKVDGFLAHVTLGDGAAALVIGADPLPEVERPIYEMYWSTQMAVPDSEHALKGRITEAGLFQQLEKDTVPILIAKHLGELTSEGKKLVGNPDNRDMFWVVHPGAYKILEVVAETMGVEKEKLQPSWDILENFGNMSSPTCLFVLDEMRQRSIRLGASSTGMGSEFGFLLGLGPGFNMELTLLRSVPIHAQE